MAEIHLNKINPFNFPEQKRAFTAGALSVAALLNHTFNEEIMRESRELDPIVGVSFTGLFDFFVTAFGADWLRWWQAGRPEEWGTIEDCDEDIELFERVQFLCDDEEFDHWIFDDKSNFYKTIEQRYLSWWKGIVRETVWDYCDRHGLKRPNRYTTVQPSGSKSLLTGASPGWHPPKAQWFIRRITFGKNDPVALACLDCGYRVKPAQSDTDENGNLLEDPFSPRCTEWLVEVPVQVPWANLPGVDQIKIHEFSALAQYDFLRNVQQNWTTHNTSATIELREGEIEKLGKAIYRDIQEDGGYISSALLSRYDDLQTFPRLPFEPCSKEEYETRKAEIDPEKFYSALAKYDQGEWMFAGPAGCDGDKCTLPETKPV